jgi:hypothetical protein
MAAFTAAEIETQITALKAQLVATTTAITSLSSGTLKSYTIDTGQTSRTVTKKDIRGLQESRQTLIGEIQFWSILRDNDGVVLARSLS